MHPRYVGGGAAAVLLLAALAAPAQQEKAAQQKKPDQQKAAQQKAQTVPAGVKALRDLEYVKGGHERQKLDLYLPEKASGPLPLVIWIHGGGWQNGSKDRCPALPFTTQGYAVASVNYRLSHHAPFPAQIEDCKAAVRWLRAHAKEQGIDPDRIGVWGASAGGHLVALLGTTGDVKEWDRVGIAPDISSRVQAVCDWFGPADLVRVVRQSKDTNGPVAKLLGGSPADSKEKAAQASPVTYVTRDDAPTLILHGDQDKLVPLVQSELLAAALRKAGVPVTLKVLPGAAHGGPAFNSPETLDVVRQFFDSQLKKK